MIRKIENRNIQVWDEKILQNLHVPDFVFKSFPGKDMEGHLIHLEHPDNSIWISYPEETDAIQVSNLARQVIADCSDKIDAWLLYDETCEIDFTKFPVLNQIEQVSYDDGTIKTQRYQCYISHITKIQEIGIIAAKSFTSDVASSILFLSNKILVNFTEYSINLVILDDNLRELIIANFINGNYGLLLPQEENSTLIPASQYRTVNIELESIN